jgi:hypothetical protein
MHLPYVIMKVPTRWVVDQDHVREAELARGFGSHQWKRPSRWVEMNMFGKEAAKELDIKLVDEVRLRA